MKIKILVVAIVLSVACSLQAFAWGIGVEGGYGLGSIPGSGNAMVTFKVADLPLMAVGLSGLGGNLAIGATADLWLIKEPLVDALLLYIGPGVYAGFQTGTGGSISGGMRLPIGLQVFPTKWLEGFIEIAPSIGIRLANPIELDWGFQGALGIRFWFADKK